MYKVAIATSRNLDHCKVGFERHCSSSVWKYITGFDFQFSREISNTLSFVLPEDDQLINNGWKITAATTPCEITKSVLDNSDCSWCELSLRWTDTERDPVELIHRVKMEGVSREEFEIAIDPHWQEVTVGHGVPLDNPVMLSHHKVTRYLKEMDDEQIMELGGALGLERHKLKRMTCLPADMVDAWLRKEDSVLSTSGHPSWQCLVTALEKISQTGIAEKIRLGELS